MRRVFIFIKGEDALTVISDIVETEPKFFKKNFNLLFEIMYKITFDKVKYNKFVNVKLIF